MSYPKLKLPGFLFHRKRPDVLKGTRAYTFSAGFESRRSGGTEVFKTDSGVDIPVMLRSAVSAGPGTVTEFQTGIHSAAYTAHFAGREKTVGMMHGRAVGGSLVLALPDKVTGRSASEIAGKLRSEIQDANLYFVNPAGVVFGLNASVDVSGSFHVSTADYVRLGENGRFDAKKPVR